MSLGGMSAACCGRMAEINPWEHEMSIYRDGEEVWCGPVTGGLYSHSKGTLELSAKDLMAWFDHRWVELLVMDQYFDDVDVAEVMYWLLEHGYSKDPFNLEYSIMPINVPMTREYTAFTQGERWGGAYPLIGDELRSLTEMGIDFTVVRRNMLGGNLHASNRGAFTLTERHWSTLPDIPMVGSTMATDLAVMGGSGGYGGWYDDQMYIARSTDTIREKYGLLQEVVVNKTATDVDTTQTNNPIKSQAQQELSIRENPFVYLNGGTLSPDAPVSVDMLVPGRAFDVQFNATCRAVEGTYRLYGINVKVADGSTEDISLEMTPIGAESISS